MSASVMSKVSRRTGCVWLKTQIARTVSSAGTSSSSGMSYSTRSDDDDDDDDVVRPTSSTTLGRGRTAAATAAADDMDNYEAMMSMDDSYGSGVLQEERTTGRRETPAEKKKRLAAELRARGVLAGDRVKVDVRVGAPLPARSKLGVAAAMAADVVDQQGSGSGAPDEHFSQEGGGASQKRWLTRAVFGYALCVRNGRVGVKRTGFGDTDESFPTYPIGWVTVLDAGEMWEINTGPRNLAGASDWDYAEYRAATASPDDDDHEDDHEEESGVLRRD